MPRKTGGESSERLQTDFHTRTTNTSQNRSDAGQVLALHRPIGQDSAEQTPGETLTVRLWTKAKSCPKM